MCCLMNLQMWVIFLYYAFLYGVFEDITTKEDVLTSIPTNEPTRGVDIYGCFKSFIRKTRFSYSRYVGTKIGFVTLCQKGWPTYNYRCIILSQVLYSRLLKADDATNKTFKTINSIKPRSLQRRQFWHLFEEQTEYGDFLCIDVKWCSCSGWKDFVNYSWI